MLRHLSAAGRLTGGADECPRSERGARSYEGEPLTALAHEPRGPLAAALYALAAMPEPDDPAARRARTIAERQTRRAARLVDDLFDVCADSHGKLSLHREVLDIAAVVAGACETAEHLLTGRGHVLTVSLPPEPAFVLADPSRLEQVVTNLLANAAKFTEPGGRIRLGVETEAEMVVLRVCDDGQGIAAHLLPQVFDLFSQGEALGERREGGLGLGLALVKSLVELHGGQVAAFSDGVGCGTEFVVRLPAYSHSDG